MAQVVPSLTMGFTGADDSPLDASDLALSQPVAMFVIMSPAQSIVARITPNLEALTMWDGELTVGLWGEGFLDSRHPHTLSHEVILSLNAWGPGSTALSVSAGKGFVPYGTDDPMSRPAVKFPTNHHLSQIPERFLVSVAATHGGWSAEASVFGGAEPSDPSDLSNIRSFGDSWSLRLTRGFGARSGAGTRAWELSASYAWIVETHPSVDGHPCPTAPASGGPLQVDTRLANVSVRHEGRYGFGSLYALVEGSVSDPNLGAGFQALLAEVEARSGRHRPYYRLERSTRAEFARIGRAGTEEFFRYRHGDFPVGASRWTIHTLGYGYAVREGVTSVRPFVEVQRFVVSRERGAIVPGYVYGTGRGWGLVAGMRVFFGGEPLRMGRYGVLDPMASMARGASGVH